MGKFAAKGALLQYESAEDTFTTIPGVQDFTLSFGETDLIDVTSHESAGNYTESVSGVKDPAEFTVPIVWDGSNTHHAALVTAHGGAAITLKITGKETAAKTYTFDALVRNIEISWPLRGAQTASVTFKPTGAITIGNAS